MDESTATPDTPSASSKPSAARIPLGMSSFGEAERQQFGQSIRLAMACIEGKVEPVSKKAMPDSISDIGKRLKALSQDISSLNADLLELLVRYDELKGWESSGSKHCAAWMNYELGISPQLAWEYLRVGKQLRLLPTTQALFRAGKLSWSKVRLITRVADADNEKTLCHSALDASVDEVQRLCCGYRWKDDNDDGSGNNEKDRALKQHETRSLTWKQNSIGSTRIQLVLPPEVAQAFLNSVEHSLNQIDDSGSQITDSESTMSQRRADAAVLMAESSLQNAGQSIATADRYQVIVSVDKSALQTQTPEKRPTVSGSNPIARETAQRIACDCSVSTNTTSNGEPVDIGRKSRIWPTAMARAIKERDQHCQFPGCSQTQHLQIHHIKHWADGGSTSVDNAVCLCSGCHVKVHEGGYKIQRVENNPQRQDEQYQSQLHNHDVGMFDFEKAMRNDRNSFNTISALSPTRFRFRVVDAKGRDIRTKLKTKTPLNKAHHYSEKSVVHSTHVECNEPKVQYLIQMPPFAMRDLNAVYRH